MIQNVIDMSTKLMKIILMIMMMIRAMFMTMTAMITQQVKHSILILCKDYVQLMAISRLQLFISLIFLQQKENCVRQLHPLNIVVHGHVGLCLQDKTNVIPPARIKEESKGRGADPPAAPLENSTYTKYLIFKKLNYHN